MMRTNVIVGVAMLMMAAGAARAADPTPTPAVEVKGADGSTVRVGNDGAVQLGGTKGTLSIPGLNGALGEAGAEGATAFMRNDAHQNIDCKGTPLSIQGNTNTLKLRNCPSVSVAGNSNRIEVGEGAAKVSVMGNSNHVLATGAHAIAVAGNTNDVTWSKGKYGKEPTVSDAGTGNTVHASK